jgi:hypothetical protein
VEWNVALLGEKEDTYRVFVGKPEWKRLFRRPRCRWQDNIKWIFKK